MSERDELVARAQATLQMMRNRDPGIQNVIDGAVGYAVLPDVGKAAFVAGAAYGRGVVFEQGNVTGYVELNQGSLGAQVGAQTFAELIVFRDRNTLNRLKAGNFSVSGNIGAVVLSTGAAATTRFVDDVAVFVMPRGGLMAELSVSGQQVNFQPAGG